jgi:DNA-3-methyladenine glycosylase II
MRLSAVPPFRLDLTVAALQRVATNPIDLWTEDGRWLRAFATPRGGVVCEAAQVGGGPMLEIRLHGPAIGDEAPWRSLLGRMLGTDLDLGPFYRRAARIPVLAELARRFRGLKPPRYASLFESFVNTIAFQQLSLASGMAAVGRLARLCSPPVAFDGRVLWPSPSAGCVARATEADLRACGFSGAKVRSLQAAASAILDRALVEEELELLPDDAAVARLRTVPGVGPWTASLLLLRGMRRLASFPIGDAGAERRLHEIFGVKDPAPVLAALGDWRGMLYFHLLLAARAGRRSNPRTRKR